MTLGPMPLLFTALSSVPDRVEVYYMFIRWIGIKEWMHEWTNEQINEQRGKKVSWQLGNVTYLIVVTMLMWRLLKAAELRVYAYIYNSLHMEATYVSIDRWMDKDVYTMEYYSAIKKQCHFAIFDNIHGLRGYYAKWNKSGRERWIPYFLLICGI